jgi:hypothetical protein
MRRGRDNSWLMDGDKLVGINFGAEFAAEHEWGIADLRNRLGVANPKADDVTRKEHEPLRGVYGLERRRCHPDPLCVTLIEQGDTLNLIVMGAYSLKHWLESKVDLDKLGGNEAYFGKGQDLVTLWDQGSFMIRVKGEENFRRLRKLHEALLANEVAVWLGGKELFGNAGLCLAIISEVGEKDAKAMNEGDLNIEKLEIAAEKCGIRQKIDEANEQWAKMREVETGRRVYASSAPHTYFALSPAWNNREPRGKYKVMFWLNPAHQNENEWGWYTVEQLEQWLRNEGPIIKGYVEKPKKHKSKK